MKEKEDEKEKEKIMETSTIPSTEVITSVKEQLKVIGFKLSFDEYDKVYSVTTYMRFFDIQSYIPELIKVLESPYANFVTKLNLASRHLIDDTKAGKLFKELKSTNITKLDLTDNNIGDAGAIALADAIKEEGSKITDLYLNNNGIRDKGATALADAIKQEGSKISVLHISINRIGDEGTKALDGLKDIIKEVVYDFQHLPITFSTASTTTTSISTTSSFEKAFDSSSSSSSPSISSSTLSSDYDTVTTSSSSFSHQSLVTESILEGADSTIPLTGESTTDSTS
jgi:hypothetical protein